MSNILSEIGWGIGCILFVIIAIILVPFVIVMLIIERIKDESVIDK